MMKEEFEKLAGFSVNYEEYKEIEADYMATDIDKVRFVKDWKKNDGIDRISRLRIRKIEELSEKLRCLESNYMSAKELECRKDIEHKAELEKLVEAKAHADRIEKDWINRYKDISQKYEELKKAIKTITEAVA
jgi:hypothetical protein